MSLALWLRQGRAQRGLSVEDVARITKIQPRILERLEAGRFEGLPADVFVRGFVRNFARAVGLDEDEALKRYTACGAAMDERGRRRGGARAGRVDVGSRAGGCACGECAAARVRDRAAIEVAGGGRSAAHAAEVEGGASTVEAEAEAAAGIAEAARRASIPLGRHFESASS